MLDIIEHDDGIREIRLARPPVNAISPDLVLALSEAVLAADKDGRQAIMLSGQPGMFSAGLDVQALMQLGRPEVEVFYANFSGLWQTLAASELPIGVAITGHAPAGGAALSIFCDHSVMAEGKYKIGLNEVAVGLTVPSPICRALAKRVGNHTAEKMLGEGRMIDPQTALRINMIDETVPVDDVIEQTLAWCRKIVSLPRNAMLQTRRQARAPLMAAFDNPDTTPENFADMWFADEAQSTVKSLIASLKDKRG